MVQLVDLIRLQLSRGADALRAQEPNAIQRAALRKCRVVARERPRVDAFVKHHARVGSQCPGELARTHIDCMDALGPGLQQGIGESAGRGADIQADSTRHVDREVTQSGGQFQPATTDERRPGQNFERGIFGYGLAGLGGLLPIEKNLASHDEGLGLLARFRQAALHQQAVKANLHDNCFVSGHGFRRAVQSGQSRALAPATTIAFSAPCVNSALAS